MTAAEALKRDMEYMRRQRERSIADAEEAIEKARKELVEIAHQLAAAKAGHPYRRIGRIDGVDGSAVFGAFGHIEQVATLERMHERDGVEEA